MRKSSIGRRGFANAIMSAPRHGRADETAFGRRRGRRRRGSTGCSGGAASRRGSPPRRSPSSRKASRAYCEQLGWYLHVPSGVSSPSVWRHACTSPIPIHFMPAPCRSPRAPAPRASRGRGPLIPPGGPAGPRGRSRVPPAPRSPSSVHASRSWRLTRFRVTAEPTARGTARPRRGGPTGLPRA